MGNTHDIRQVEPISIWGAVIAIRDGAEDQVELALSSVERRIAAFVEICVGEIRVPNMLYRNEVVAAPDGFYLVLQSGSSQYQGYDKFRDLLTNLAGYLGDCKFYVADEVLFIDTYVIKDGQLGLKRLITGGHRPLDVFLKVPDDKWKPSTKLVEWPGFEPPPEPARKAGAAPASFIQDNPQRQATSEIEKALIGVWTPCINRVPNVPAWPRLVFLSDRRCLFEQGDYPAVYAVDHFRWRIVHSTVLELSQHRVEMLADNGRGTEWDEDGSEPAIRTSDVALHSWPEGFILETDILGAMATGSYMKTPEVAGDTYRSDWRFR